MASRSPRIDPGAKRRLSGRFGAKVTVWFEHLPPVLDALATRWEFEFEEAIARGTVSVVFRCRLSDGRGAVLKVSPDLPRIASEAAGLSSWVTRHVPAVLASDERLGALLIERIEPGTPLVVSSTYPELPALAELLVSLHARGAPDRRFPTVAQRVASLFDSSTALYERHPDLTELVSPELYGRGRRLTERLATTTQAVLCHGDLTPSNILDGGRRGLIAIDPAPCRGDPAFDAVDLILWQADDLEVIRDRVRGLSEAAELNATRLEEWCVAFAAMAALELGSERRGALRPRPFDTLLQLAARAPAT